MTSYLSCISGTRLQHVLMPDSFSGLDAGATGPLLVLTPAPSFSDLDAGATLFSPFPNGIRKSFGRDYQIHLRVCRHMPSA